MKPVRMIRYYSLLRFPYSPILKNVLDESWHDVSLGAQVLVLVGEGPPGDLGLQLQPDQILQLVLPNLFFAADLQRALRCSGRGSTYTIRGTSCGPWTMPRLCRKVKLPPI